MTNLKKTDAKNTKKIDGGKFGLKRAAIIAVMIAAVLTVLAAAGCNGAKSDPDLKLPKTNIAPKPLKPQPEPSDSGEDFEFTVNGTISSHMVVQRNSYFNVFGHAEKTGGVIYGSFMGEERYAVVDENGGWEMSFSSHEATREEQTLELHTKNGAVKSFDDILIGDVWVISGQSNAELTYGFTSVKYPDYRKEIHKDDAIRIYTQTRQSVMDAHESGKVDVTQPQEDVIGETSWSRTTLSQVLPFSALGYFFGKELSRTVDVPLGLVEAASGGSTLHELMPNATAEKLGFKVGAAVPVSGFYNTLLHPFTRNKITGMIFYQGESESGGDQYKVYARNLKETVSAYRHAWGLCFPFINVQLSSHGVMGEQNWVQLPEIRAAQFDANRMMTNAYIVTAMDQGFVANDPDWAHPCYKYELGKRAAKIAACIVYGQGDEQHSLAPEPDKIKWGKDNTVTVTFKNVGDGVTFLSGDSAVGLYAIDEYGDKMYCDFEWIDGATVKISGTREIVGISYGMVHDGSVKNANIASSDGIPMPAFKITK